MDFNLNEDDFECEPEKEENTAGNTAGNGSKPSGLAMPLTKMNDVCFGKGQVDPKGSDFTLRVSPKDAKKEVLVRDCRIILDFESENLPGTLSPYDGEVLNAVCTLAEAGRYEFSVSQIYETMAGKKTKNQHALDNVRDSMRKLMRTLHSFTWTDHAQMNGLRIVENKDKGKKGKKKLYSAVDENGKEVNSVVLEENVIYAEHITLTLFGKTADGYRLLKPPALLEYAKTVKQITYVSKELLNVPGVSNTEKNIVIKNELIKRLEKIKNRKSKDKAARTIRLATLFHTCKISGTKTEMSRNRTVVFNLLDYYVKIGYIKGYKKNMQKQSIISVEIEF